MLYKAGRPALKVCGLPVPTARIRYSSEIIKGIALMCLSSVLITLWTHVDDMSEASKPWL